MANKTDSQNKRIAEFLKNGGFLTPLDALRLFGCFRLSARIHDLRHKQGMTIRTKIVQFNEKNFAGYYL